MKNYINLLPRETVVKKNPWIPWGIFIGAAFGGVLLAYVLLLYKIDALRAEVHELLGQQAHVLEEQRQAHTQAPPGTGHLPPPEAVKGRLSERISWSSPLRQITLIVPEGVSLNKIESVDPPSGGTWDKNRYTGVRIEGKAVSYFRITDLMAGFQRHEIFGEPFLSNADAGGSAEVQEEDGRIHFEMIAPIRRGEV
jgi:hypothetical protein